MPVPSNTIDFKHVARQVQQNLMTLQAEMRLHCASHKQSCTEQSVSLAVMQQRVSDHARIWLAALQRIADRRANPTQRQQLLDALAADNITEAHLIEKFQPLRQAAIAFRDAPRTSYAEIITACDAVLADINPRDNLWPE